MTDAQREWLEPFVRGNPVGPKPGVHSRREGVNALLYVTPTGAQWRYLPHALPDWQLVYYSFRPWKEDGTVKLIHDALRSQGASEGWALTAAHSRHSR